MTTQLQFIIIIIIILLWSCVICRYRRFGGNWIKQLLWVVRTYPCGNRSHLSRQLSPHRRSVYEVYNTSKNQSLYYICHRQTDTYREKLLAAWCQIYIGNYLQTRNNGLKSLLGYYAAVPVNRSVQKSLLPAHWAAETCCLHTEQQKLHVTHKIVNLTLWRLTTHIWVVPHR